MPATDRAPAAELACRLSTDGLAERLDAWRAVAAQALARTVSPGRVSATYPNDPGTVDRLTELIAAERDCCPFLRLELRERGDVLDVELAYPPGFEPLGQLLGAA